MKDIILSVYTITLQRELVVRRLVAPVPRLEALEYVPFDSIVSVCSYGSYIHSLRHECRCQQLLVFLEHLLFLPFSLLESTCIDPCPLFKSITARS